MYIISIHKNEPVSSGIRRILHDLTDGVLFHCADRTDIHMSIHEIRRNLKKIRAILRLIKDVPGYKDYDHDNQFYRDMGRILSEIRSIEILDTSLQLMRSKFRHLRYHHSFDKISKQIFQNRNEIIKNKIEKERVLDYIASEIGENNYRLTEIQLDYNSYSVFLSGIKRAFSQGRKYMKICRENPDIHSIHEFRKKVKYLLSQLQVVYQLFPEMFKTYISILDKIGDRLGIYRDLYELAEFISHNSVDNELQQLLPKLNEVIDKIKYRHLYVAMQYSEKFFALDTKSFFNQVEKYISLHEQ